jgi:hypothetical protein
VVVCLITDTRAFSARLPLLLYLPPTPRTHEETSPEHIIAETHAKLHAGTPVKDMLLASALAVVRSSDLPPGHHGGPLHPLAGLHAVHHMAARLPGDYAMLPVIQNVALSNKHIHSPTMGPYILPEATPVSENDSIEHTREALYAALDRGVYNAADHYFLYFHAKALTHAGARRDAAHYHSKKSVR